jgi:hypothetical protein
MPRTAAGRSVGCWHVSQTIRLPNIHLVRQRRTVTRTRVIFAGKLSPDRDELCPGVMRDAVVWRLGEPLATSSSRHGGDGVRSMASNVCKSKP